MKAENDANAARLMAIHAGGTSNSVAVKLAGFQGSLRYYRMSMFEKVRGQANARDEENVEVFVRTLNTVGVFSGMVTIDGYWKPCMNWVDLFTSSLQ